MADYWFPTYDEQVEYFQICDSIRRFRKDLRENVADYSHAQLQRMRTELRNFEDEKQEMQNRGHRVF
jgi:hypothetical protein